MCLHHSDNFQHALTEANFVNNRSSGLFTYDYSVFVSIRFCCIETTVHTTPFSYKKGEKNLRFCAFTLICPITKTQRKTSVFVRSHYSVFVKLIVGYWSVFKNLRFRAFTLIKCVFKNLRFCGCPLLTAFSKTSVFVAFLC